MDARSLFYSIIGVREGSSAMNYKDVLATSRTQLEAVGITLQTASDGLIRGRIYLNNSIGPFEHAVDPFSGNEDNGTLKWNWSDRGGPEFIQLGNDPVPPVVVPVPSGVFNQQVLDAVNALSARLDKHVADLNHSLGPVVVKIMSL